MFVCSLLSKIKPPIKGVIIMANNNEKPLANKLPLFKLGQ